MTEAVASRVDRAPVLCLAFNRPDSLAQVLAALEAAGPREYFFAVDGPRPHRPDDAGRCAAVKQLVDGVHWATRIHRKFEAHNLGCGPAVASAISWALEQVPELIVIEDDCVPDPSFLFLCDELLARYRDDTRVMQIGGSNWGADEARFAGRSYAFTSFAPVWGWATWRRAWALYDYELESWPRVRDSGLNQGMALSRRFRRMLERDWQQVLDGGGTWDHQWQYAVLRHHGLNVCPSRNLVRNIGFDADGTQLKSPDRILSRVSLDRLEFPLRHPPEVARSESVESVFERVYWLKLGDLARFYRAFTRIPVLGPAVHRVLRLLVPRPA